jgi:hypothetical protein
MRPTPPAAPKSLLKIMSGRDRRRGVLLASIALAAAALLPAPQAFAYRPFEGTDAGVAALHKLEVEMAPLQYLRIGDERFLASPEVNVTYGAGSGFEFGAEARRLMLMNPDPDGAKPKIDEARLTAKRLLRPGSAQDKKGWSVAAEGSLLLPSAAQRRLGAGLLLVASQSWEDFALHVNGEVSKTRDGETGRLASLIGEGPSRWGVRPVAEAAWEGDTGEPTLRTLLLGLIWQTRAGLAMDLGYVFGYSDERVAELRLGVTWDRHVSGPRLPPVPLLPKVSR